MSVLSICWQEGMFMWPHHMQQEVRLHGERGRLNHKWDVHHNWGLRHLELDMDALATGQLVIRRLQARMRDGTLIDVPDEGKMPFLDLHEVLESAEQATIHLGVARLQPQRANAATVSAEEPVDSDARFLVEEIDVPDENTGADQQKLPFRTLNLKLFGAAEGAAGYELLPIARIQKVPGAEAALQLDPTYIPPLLACDAWHVLAVDILQSAFHQFSTLMDSYARQVLNRGVGFETQSPGDALLLGHLGCLNEAVSVLRTLAFVPGIHPLPVYLEMCRIVGQMAVFDGDGRVPELPAYDHDDLGGCFYKVKRQLDLKTPPKVGFVERPFVGEELRMQVALEAEWLEPTWSAFVGVHSASLPGEEVVRLLTRAGQLDMKIGCGKHVDEYFRRGIPGLKFTMISQPPRVLPNNVGLTYFQVSRDPQDAWAKVLESKTLAIRLNQVLLEVNAEGKIPAQSEVALKRPRGAQAPVVLKFTLYVVPKQF